MVVKNQSQLKALFGSNVWINLIYLLSFVVMGLILNPVEFGSLRVALAYISVAVSIAMLGLNTAVTHQFPLFTHGQRVRSWTLIRKIIVTTSICLGFIVYALVPSVAHSENSFQEVLYILSFPIAVVGASLCNVLLSVYQAQGDLNGYARLQAQWKTLLFVFGLGGSVLHQAQTALIAMALAYVGIYILQYRNSLMLHISNETSNIVLSDIIGPLYRSSIWPFASICISVIYSNIEFFYVNATDLSSGVAGAYSLASLIFIGGAAFFTPLQTYAGSLVVNRKVGLAGLLKLQLGCLIGVFVLSLIALGVSFLLTQVHPLKFNNIFFDFAVLVCIKLLFWGSYAVIGSVLNYLDKGFESFVLTVVCLMSIAFGSLLMDGTYSLRDMLIFQIVSSLILLGGSFYLVVDACKGRIVETVTTKD